MTKDPCQEDLPQAPAIGAQLDAQIQVQATIPPTPNYDLFIARLKQEASISPSMTIRGAVDLQCSSMFAGGRAGFNVAYVDGKLLDILSEYATYRALSEVVNLGVDRIAAINAIVAYHEQPGFRCFNALPNLFLRSALIGTQVQRADQILDSLAGVLVYHEFGHLWAHAISDSLILNYVPGASFYYYPSKVEDDADEIAGVLTKKARHDVLLAEEVFDLMTFSALYRNFAVTSIVNIEQSYSLQFLSTSPSYSPLATRKALLARGYSITP